MNDDQFAVLLSYALNRNHERRNIECKGARPATDKLFFAKVARAMMGMANLKDGGQVIIGVEEVGGQLHPSGLTPDHLKTWQYDDVASLAARFADPQITFDLEKRQFRDKHFILIDVEEFDDIPIICKRLHTHIENKGLPNQTTTVITREGACYVRGRGKAETVEVPSQTEMRELLDLAIAKGVRRFITTIHGAGVDLSSAARQNDRARFRQQAGDLLEDEA